MSKNYIDTQPIKKALKHFSLTHAPTVGTLSPYAPDKDGLRVAIGAKK